MDRFDAFLDDAPQMQGGDAYDAFLDGEEDSTSVMKELARAGARTVRSGMTGAAGILDLVENPVRQTAAYALNKAGFDETAQNLSNRPTYAEGFQKGFDYLTNDFAAPRNTAERRVDRAVEFAGGAMVPAAGMAKAGQAGAQGVGRLAQFLAPRTGTEMAGTLAAGYANQAAQDAELGTAGQLAATIVAGASPMMAQSAARGVGQAAAKAGGVVKRTAFGGQADDILGDIVKRSEQSPQQLRAEIQQGEISTLADVGGDEVRGLTRAVGKTAGGRNIIADALEGRSEQAVKRVSSLLSREISDVDTFFGNLDDVVKARSKVAEPLYKRAYAEGANISDTRLNKYLQDSRVIEAENTARKMYGVRLEAPRNSVENLDGVKKVLDDQIGEALRADKRNLAGSLLELKNGIVDVLDSAAPSYKRARKVFSDFSQIKSAQEAGLDFSNQTPEQIKRYVSKLSPDQLDAYRIGVRENLQRVVNKTADGADPAKKIFGNTQKREQLKAVFGDGKAYNQFAKRLNEEIRAAETKYKVLGGSRTDFNLDADAEFASTLQMAAQRGVVGTLADKAIGYVSNAIARRYYGLNEANAKAIARALVDREEGLKALEKIIQKQAPKQRAEMQAAVANMLREQPDGEAKNLLQQIKSKIDTSSKAVGAGVKKVGKALEGKNTGAIGDLSKLDDIVTTRTRGDVIEVPMVRVPKAEQGQGKARAAMEQLIEKADERGETIALTPSSDFGANKARLTKFYKSLGFVENKGADKNFSTQEALIRTPKQNLPIDTANGEIDLEALIQSAGKAIDKERQPVIDGAIMAKNLSTAMPDKIRAAKQQGFDVSKVVFRGLNKPYEEGIASNKAYQMFTTSADDASGYAEYSMRGGNVLPAFVRKGKNLQIDAGGVNFNSIPTSQLPEKVKAALGSRINRPITTDELAFAAKEAGYDSVSVSNVFDNTSNERIGKSVGIEIVFDPKNIRSVYAKFDPKKSNSANLTAGVGALGLAGMYANQDKFNKGSR